ncbi:MAG: winged helix-turn-helix domain-containing protein [Pyrinomonadaceae bacterium]|nr:winged helix-turn-helix domain-containing protein [Pyrinomonadaceae bacterium]
MQEIHQPLTYEFGEFRLDARSQRLTRRDSGEAVSLTPRAVLLLKTLVCSKGRLLTKEELLDRVWAGSIVEEGNLSQTIFVLRKALGEGKKDPKFILTVPGRGYQFIATVNEMTDTRSLDINKFERFSASPKVNTAAFESYVQARSFWNKRTEVGLKQAVTHFEEAIRQDPNFAFAYSGLADSHRMLADFYSAALPSGRAEGLSDAERIRAELSVAHTTLGYAKAFHDWDWAKAKKEFLLAIELDPSSGTTHQWYGDLLNVLGRFNDAYEHFSKAISLAPGSAIAATGLAGYFYTQRNARDLIRQAKRIIEIDPDFGYGHFYLGFGFEFAGMEAESVDALATAATKFGEPAEIGEELKSAYKQNGMNGVWHKRLEQYETRPHLKNYPRYLKSLVPIRLGDKETSLAWLTQAFEHRDRGVIYAKHEPLLEPLRSDRRFKELVRRIGLD